MRLAVWWLTPGNLFIADSGKSRVRMVSQFASYPTLALNNVTARDAGNYSVILTGPYGSFTSSLVTLSAATAPPISKSVFNPDGSVTLNLLTAPNIGSRVFAATNLTPPVIWQPICTNVAGPAGAWQFTDTNAAATGPVLPFRHTVNEMGANGCRTL